MKNFFNVNKRSRCTIFFLLLALGTFQFQPVHSESYTLEVGESVSINHLTYMGGYIANVGLTGTFDSHLSFKKGPAYEAIISVNSYFDYPVTITIVFLESYQTFYNKRYHKHTATYYKEVTIKCKYQAPEPIVNPTKVLLPERIRVPVYNGGERDYITPILEPYGAKGTTYYWGNHQGTAVFAARTMSDGRCWITGRSPGIGKVYVVVNNDRDNLYASTKLEVVDPNNLPPDNIFLPNEIEISINGTSTLTPILVPENTSTAYTWQSEDESIATVSFGKVTGKNVGSTSIILTTANELTATCTVKVVSRDGKDDEEYGGNDTGGSLNGHDYVDLGLSVKWATCNIGATSPESYGSYFAWGETTEKTTYTWSTYQYCEGSFTNVYNIGNDINGTSYDAAHVNWGNDWRMPTEKEMGELISKCTFIEEKINDTNGYLVTGPNGNSIFFPSAGIMKDKKNGGCKYWTSTVWDYYGKNLEIIKNKNNVISPSVNSEMRSFGLPIRAVTTVHNDESPVEPSTVSLPESLFINVGEKKTITPTISPSNASTKLTWTSDDANIATVSSLGLVTGIKAGSTTIRVTTSNGKTDDCRVTVEANTKLELSASPSGGNVSAGTTVTLSAKANGSTVSGCDIYYTLNGNTPSKSNGTKYSYGITINSSCTLKAIAYKEGYADSEVLTMSYIVRQSPNIEVEMSNKGYATFYSSEHAYTLPSGLSAHVVTGTSEAKLTYRTIADGSVSSVVPRGSAVMLISDSKQAGSYTLTPTESTVTYNGTNLLHGSDEATTTTGDGLHYKLSYGPSDTGWRDVFGWYWGGQNGAPFQIEGHKAWLVVPKASGSRGYTIDSDATGIGIVDTDEANDCYYDLQGRRIKTPVRNGVYIQNGCKVVVK